MSSNFSEPIILDIENKRIQRKFPEMAHISLQENGINLQTDLMNFYDSYLNVMYFA